LFPGGHFYFSNSRSILDDAKIFAAEHKNNFDRVVLVLEGDERQKMVVRYVDGP
jgi:hypothetical protein